MINIIGKLLHTKGRLDKNDAMIKKWLICTKRFVREHPDILFTRADKGNITITLDKHDYITKLEGMLSDGSTYETVDKDLSKKITNELRTLLARWKKKEYIESDTYKKILVTDGLLPRAYGLPKVHKKIIH